MAEALPNDHVKKESGSGQKQIRRRTTMGSGKARGIASRIQRFSPAWGSAAMGCGIPSNLLYLLPWMATHPVFRGIGAGFLILDAALLLLFTCMWLARYTIWPNIIMLTLRDSTHSLFLGTVPMGFVTVATAIANYGQGYQIQGSLIAASVLFWICSAMSLLCVCVVPFFMMTKHGHKQERLTAAWLLPFVPGLTCAASGSVISGYLVESRPIYALNIWLASYIQCGIGLVCAFSILVLYLQRLIMHHLPDGEVIVSTFLPIGAAGQAGYAAVRLGLVARELFPELARRYPSSDTWSNLAEIAGAMHATGILLGLLLFGVCFFWLFLAVASVLSLWIRKPSKFSLGWWAFTFPIGSMDYLTYALADVFDNIFLKIFGTILTATVCLLWVIVFIPTLRGFKRGTLFDAPCLKSAVKDSKLDPQKERIQPEIAQDIQTPTESQLT